MEVTSEIDERLHRMATDAYALATRRCGACINLHALWPYLRIARIVSGAGLASSGRNKRNLRYGA